MMQDIGFDYLREAIVKQAIEDYADAALIKYINENYEFEVNAEILRRRKKLKKDICVSAVEADIQRKNNIARCDKRTKECEKFFIGEWCSALCGISGTKLLTIAKQVAIAKIAEKEEKGIRKLIAKKELRILL